MVKEVKNWNHFVVLCLKECLERNENNPKHIYTCNYEYDEIEIMYCKNENDIIKPLLASISLSRNEYDANNVDNDILVHRLFKDISKQSISLEVKVK